MDTRDLSSYYPGYDDYCEDLENRAKVPYSDYEKLETKITGYNGLLDDIKSIFSEETTASNQIEMLKDLINDFEEESKNV